MVLDSRTTYSKVFRNWVLIVFLVHIYSVNVLVSAYIEYESKLLYYAKPVCLSLHWSLVGNLIKTLTSFQ